MVLLPCTRPSSPSGRGALLSLLVTLAFGLLLAQPVQAAEHVVMVQNFDFIPQDIIIQEGDTVKWVWMSGTHTASSGNEPGDPQANMFFHGTLDSGNPEYSAVIDNFVGVIPYHCQPHWFVGMTGSITVQPVGPSAALHQVAVRNFEFDPPQVFIAPGDTVRWVWETGDHTTTNGAGSASGLNAGSLWDAPLGPGNPSVDFVFGDSTGIFAYFCRPHETLDMRGQVIVGSVTGVPGDGPRPARIELQPPFPNPSSAVSSLTFRLPAESRVLLEVFDITGRRVATLLDETRSAGTHVVGWDGSNARGRTVGSGIFFARLTTDSVTEVRKIFRTENQRAAD